MSHSHRDDAFELLRAAPRKAHAGLLSATVAALVAAAWFAMSSWSALQRVQVQAIAGAAAEADAGRRLDRLSAEAAQRATLRLQAVLQPRAAVARWLTEVERCHPRDSQLHRLTLDVTDSSVAMDVAVPVGPRLEDWLQCLNEELSAPAWRVVRVSADESASGAVRVSLARRDRR